MEGAALEQHVTWLSAQTGCGQADWVVAGYPLDQMAGHLLCWSQRDWKPGQMGSGIVQRSSERPEQVRQMHLAFVACWMTQRLERHRCKESEVLVLVDPLAMAASDSAARPAGG